MKGKTGELGGESWLQDHSEVARDFRAGKASQNSFNSEESS